MGQTSKVTQANTLSKSVRATIPNSVAEYLGVKLGDVLEWETLTQNGKKAVRVRKLQ